DIAGEQAIRTESGDDAGEQRADSAAEDDPTLAIDDDVFTSAPEYPRERRRAEDDTPPPPAAEVQGTDGDAVTPDLRTAAEDDPTLAIDDDVFTSAPEFPRGRSRDAQDREVPPGGGARDEGGTSEGQGTGGTRNDEVEASAPEYPREQQARDTSTTSDNDTPRAEDGVRDETTEARDTGDTRNDEVEASAPEYPREQQVRDTSTANDNDTSRAEGSVRDETTEARDTGDKRNDEAETDGDERQERTSHEAEVHTREDTRTPPPPENENRDTGDGTRTPSDRDENEVAVEEQTTEQQEQRQESEEQPPREEQQDQEQQREENREQRQETEEQPPREEQQDQEQQEQQPPEPPQPPPPPPLPRTYGSSLRVDRDGATYALDHLVRSRFAAQDRLRTERVPEAVRDFLADRHPRMPERIRTRMVQRFRDVAQDRGMAPFFSRDGEPITVREGRDTWQVRVKLGADDPEGYRHVPVEQGTGTTTTLWENEQRSHGHKDGGNRSQGGRKGVGGKLTVNPLFLGATPSGLSIGPVLSGGLTFGTGLRTHTVGGSTAASSTLEVNSFGAPEAYVADLRVDLTVTGPGPSAPPAPRPGDAGPPPPAAVIRDGMALILPGEVTPRPPDAPERMVFAPSGRTGDTPAADAPPPRHPRMEHGGLPISVDRIVPHDVPEGGPRYTDLGSWLADHLMPRRSPWRSSTARAREEWRENVRRFFDNESIQEYLPYLEAGPVTLRVTRPDGRVRTVRLWSSATEYNAERYTPPVSEMSWKEKVDSTTTDTKGRRTTAGASVGGGFGVEVPLPTGGSIRLDMPFVEYGYSRTVSSETQGSAQGGGRGTMTREVPTGGDFAAYRVNRDIFVQVDGERERHGFTGESVELLSPEDVSRLDEASRAADPAAARGAAGPVPTPPFRHLAGDHPSGFAGSRIRGFDWPATPETPETGGTNGNTGNDDTAGVGGTTGTGGTNGDTGTGGTTGTGDTTGTRGTTGTRADTGTDDTAGTGETDGTGDTDGTPPPARDPDQRVHERLAQDVLNAIAREHPGMVVPELARSRGDYALRPGKEKAGFFDRTTRERWGFRRDYDTAVQNTMRVLDMLSPSSLRERGDELASPGGLPIHLDESATVDPSLTLGLKEVLRPDGVTVRVTADFGALEYRGPTSTETGVFMGGDSEMKSGKGKGASHTVALNAGAGLVRSQAADARGVAARLGGPGVAGIGSYSHSVERGHGVKHTSDTHAFFPGGSDLWSGPVTFNARMHDYDASDQARGTDQSVPLLTEPLKAEYSLITPRVLTESTPAVGPAAPPTVTRLTSDEARAIIEGGFARPPAKVTGTGTDTSGGDSRTSGTTDNTGTTSTTGTTGNTGTDRTTENTGTTGTTGNTAPATNTASTDGTGPAIDGVAPVGTDADTNGTTPDTGNTRGTGDTTGNNDTGETAPTVNTETAPNNSERDDTARETADRNRRRARAIIDAGGTVERVGTALGSGGPGPGLLRRTFEVFSRPERVFHEGVQRKLRSFLDRPGGRHFFDNLLSSSSLANDPAAFSDGGRRGRAEMSGGVFSPNDLRATAATRVEPENVEQFQRVEIQMISHAETTVDARASAGSAKSGSFKAGSGAGGTTNRLVDEEGGNPEGLTPADARRPFVVGGLSNVWNFFRSGRTVGTQDSFTSSLTIVPKSLQGYAYQLSGTVTQAVELMKNWGVAVPGFWSTKFQGWSAHVSDLVTGYISARDAQASGIVEDRVTTNEDGTIEVGPQPNPENPEHVRVRPGFEDSGKRVRPPDPDAAIRDLVRDLHRQGYELTAGSREQLLKRLTTQLGNTSGPAAPVPVRIRPKGAPTVHASRSASVHVDLNLSRPRVSYLASADLMFESHTWKSSGTTTVSRGSGDTMGADAALLAPTPFAGEDRGPDEQPGHRPLFATPAGAATATESGTRSRTEGDEQTRTVQLEMSGPYAKVEQDGGLSLRLEFGDGRSAEGSGDAGTVRTLYPYAYLDFGAQEGTGTDADTADGGGTTRDTTESRESAPAQNDTAPENTTTTQDTAPQESAPAQNSTAPENNTAVQESAPAQNDTAPESITVARDGAPALDGTAPQNTTTTRDTAPADTTAIRETAPQESAPAQNDTAPGNTTTTRDNVATQDTTAAKKNRPAPRITDRAANEHGTLAEAMRDRASALRARPGARPVDADTLMMPTAVGERGQNVRDTAAVAIARSLGWKPEGGGHDARNLRGAREFLARKLSLDPRYTPIESSLDSTALKTLFSETAGHDDGVPLIEIGSTQWRLSAVPDLNGARVLDVLPGSRLSRTDTAVHSTANGVSHESGGAGEAAFRPAGLTTESPVYDEHTGIMTGAATVPTRGVDGSSADAGGLTTAGPPTGRGQRGGPAYLIEFDTTWIVGGRSKAPWSPFWKKDAPHHVQHTAQTRGTVSAWVSQADAIRLGVITPEQARNLEAEAAKVGRAGETMADSEGAYDRDRGGLEGPVRDYVRAYEEYAAQHGPDPREGDGSPAERWRADRLAEAREAYEAQERAYESSRERYERDMRAWVDALNGAREGFRSPEVRTGGGDEGGGAAGPAGGTLTADLATEFGRVDGGDRDARSEDSAPDAGERKKIDGLADRARALEAAADRARAEADRAAELLDQARDELSQVPGDRDGTVAVPRDLTEDVTAFEERARAFREGLERFGAAPRRTGDEVAAMTAARDGLLADAEALSQRADAALREVEDRLGAGGDGVRGARDLAFRAQELAASAQARAAGTRAPLLSAETAHSALARTAGEAGGVADARAVLDRVRDGSTQADEVAAAVRTDAGDVLRTVEEAAARTGPLSNEERAGHRDLTTRIDGTRADLEAAAIPEATPETPVESSPPPREDDRGDGPPPGDGDTQSGEGRDDTHTATDTGDTRSGDGGTRSGGDGGARSGEGARTGDTGDGPPITDDGTRPGEGTRAVDGDHGPLTTDGGTQSSEGARANDGDRNTASAETSRVAADEGARAVDGEHGPLSTDGGAHSGRSPRTAADDGDTHPGEDTRGTGDEGRTGGTSGVSPGREAVGGGRRGGGRPDPDDTDDSTVSDGADSVFSDGGATTTDGDGFSLFDGTDDAVRDDPPPAYETLPPPYSYSELVEQLTSKDTKPSKEPRPDGLPSWLFDARPVLPPIAPMELIIATAHVPMVDLDLSGQPPAGGSQNTGQENTGQNDADGSDDSDSGTDSEGEDAPTGPREYTGSLPVDRDGPAHDLDYLVGSRLVAPGRLRADRIPEAVDDALRGARPRVPRAAREAVLREVERYAADHGIEPFFGRDGHEVSAVHEGRTWKVRLRLGADRPAAGPPAYRHVPVRSGEGTDALVVNGQERAFGTAAGDKVAREARRGVSARFAANPVYLGPAVDGLPVGPTFSAGGSFGTGLRSGSAGGAVKSTSVQAMDNTGPAEVYTADLRLDLGLTPPGGAAVTRPPRPAVVRDGLALVLSGKAEQRPDGAPQSISLPRRTVDRDDGDGPVPHPAPRRNPPTWHGGLPVKIERVVPHGQEAQDDPAHTDLGSWLADHLLPPRPDAGDTSRRARALNTAHERIRGLFDNNSLQEYLPHLDRGPVTLKVTAPGGGTRMLRLWSSANEYRAYGHSPHLVDLARHDGSEHGVSGSSGRSKTMSISLGAGANLEVTLPGGGITRLDIPSLEYTHARTLDAQGHSLSRTGSRRTVARDFTETSEFVAYHVERDLFVQVEGEPHPHGFTGETVEIVSLGDAEVLDDASGAGRRGLDPEETVSPPLAHLRGDPVTDLGGATVLGFTWPEPAAPAADGAPAQNDGDGDGVQDDGDGDGVQDGDGARTRDHETVYERLSRQVLDAIARKHPGLVVPELARTARDYARRPGNENAAYLKRSWREHYGLRRDFDTARENTLRVLDALTPGSLHTGDTELTSPEGLMVHLTETAFVDPTLMRDELLRPPAVTVHVHAAFGGLSFRGRTPTETGVRLGGDAEGGASKGRGHSDTLSLTVGAGLIRSKEVDSRGMGRRMGGAGVTLSGTRSSSSGTSRGVSHSADDLIIFPGGSDIWGGRVDFTARISEYEGQDRARGTDRSTPLFTDPITADYSLITPRVLTESTPDRPREPGTDPSPLDDRRARALVEGPFAGPRRTPAADDRTGDDTGDHTGDDTGDGPAPAPNPAADLMRAGGSVERIDIGPLRNVFSAFSGFTRGLHQGFERKLGEYLATTGGRTFFQQLFSPTAMADDPSTTAAGGRRGRP
ncbi:hypothetical protein ACJOS4_27560, partial [Nocardiopsis sp. frass3]